MAKSNPTPPSFKLENVIRPNILSLEPYRCARDDYDEGILLDANENNLGHSIISSNDTSQFTNVANGASSSDPTNVLDLPLHRYPSPYLSELKTQIAQFRASQYPFQSSPLFDHSQIFLGVGSDEIMDLLVRISCKPGFGDSDGERGDKLMICPPTYGMYKVVAKVNDVGVQECPLDIEGGKFSLQVDELNSALSASLSTPTPIRLLFLTSPGNPTGTLLSLSSIRQILTNPCWNGLVVIDEAYVDFAIKDQPASALELLSEGFENLIVVQTLSKSFGLAGIRLGISFQSPRLTSILSATKAPYSISSPTAHLASLALREESLTKLRKNLEEVVRMRQWLEGALRNDERFKRLGLGEVIGSSDANFLMVRILEKPSTSSSSPSSKLRPSNERAQAIYKHLAENASERGWKVVVRFRGKELGCEGCLRLSVGSETEMKELVERLKEVMEVL